jgi:putative GTP pyrophosphokinase
MGQEDVEAWLRQALPKHERLKAAASSLLENILKEHSIEYLSVQGRVKPFNSAFDKTGRKNYKKPQEELTDLTGIRVVTFLENQVIQVGKAIRRLFEVDDKNSLDRASILGQDKIGYRSTHFVCSLGRKRESLPEYEGLGELKFEIQVRTVLQHAWAELAHDRSFKFGPGLPAHIERKLNLYSGMLEVVDAGFETISNEIDDYRKSLETKTLNQISSIEINNLSLDKFVETLSKQLGVKAEKISITSDLIEELRHYGIDTIGQLEALVTDEFRTNFNVSTTNIGLIRDLMLYNDIEKYLSGPAHWQGMGEDTVEFLSQKYDRGKITRLLKEHGKSVIEEIRPRKRKRTKRT